MYESDAYQDSILGHHTSLLNWLEDFRSRYGDFSEAKEAVDQVQEAMLTYYNTIGTATAKLGKDDVSTSFLVVIY